MPLPHSIIIKIMRGRDLHHAGTEFLVNVFVGDDGDVAPTQRQFHLLADQVFIALIFWVYHHRHVTQHGLWAGGGDC